jgi:acetyl-CoA C-acetyltransferase
VHESALRIVRGEVDTVAVVGAEAMNAHSLARKEGRKVDWERQSDDVPIPDTLEEERIPFTSVEYEQGLTLPVEVYPLFENARRARLGWSIDKQREQLGTLWSHFAQVAAKNPNAWLRTNPSPEEIATPSATNRMVSFPYTKLMVANLPVDMGAAYIMTSFEHARRLGVSHDAMVFPECGADATDHWYLSQRLQLDDSPAMREIWRGLEGFGAREDQLEHLDLYSCFPTVVQTACDVLGINAFDPSRVPTVTGGLTFGGGPGNNYVTHSICSMVERLRDDRDARGLVSGLGWFSTKHSWGTYATSPPANGFQWHDAQPRVDEQPVCECDQRDADVVIETYTVSHNREGAPTRLVAAARTNDNVRVWCHSDDPDVLLRGEREELIGLNAMVNNGVVTF